MKAVILAVALLSAMFAGVSVRATAADAGADVVAAFNTHDADTIELEDATEMETDTTTEAELVDAAQAEAADSVQFEDELDAHAEGEEQSDADAAEGVANEEEMDADERAELAAENEAEAAHSQLAEADMASLTEADLQLAEGDMAGVKAKKCTPQNPVKCPDGSIAFSKVARAPDYNGCGPDGNRILNDNTLGGTFSPCCNNHDLCYGSKTSASKDTCDNNFYTCMKDACKGGVLCKAKAWIYFQAVSIGGCGAWTNARLMKGCVTGPNASRNVNFNATTKATPAQTAAAGQKFFGAAPAPVKAAAPKAAAPKAKPAPKKH